MSIRQTLIAVTVFAGVVAAHTPGMTASLMVEKNLFSQDRKPPAQESAVASEQPNRPGVGIANIQLDGVMVQGNNRKAILRIKTQASPGRDKKKASPFVTVREGQQFGDYRVVKIDSKSVSLEKDGQTHVIALFAENKISTPATPAGPPAQTVAVKPASATPGGPQKNQPPGGAPAPQVRESDVQAQTADKRGREIGGVPQQVPPPIPGAPGYNDPNFNPNLQRNGGASPPGQGDENEETVEQGPDEERQ
ncbi:MAG: hypothetical protein LLG06_17685 [Desulfobacteraceae bacterium]|nr:hypothetical protein [Desulfobacteraceae bacterium]